jgi:hypothetical protein
MTIQSTDSLLELNTKAQGWLRFIWDKATTQDDWSSSGKPHDWWDKSSTPPMCSFPRFDLSETSYALPMMADQTPAWREVYTRIADELVGRYTTYWAAVDWLTLIGEDPHQDQYPPEWLVWLPEDLRGKYNPPGWTGNGIKPWGLQPDPIGADGNLFFRGFFNLLLGTYSYVSGDDKWEKPFQVAGYNDRLFQWTQPGIPEFIEQQWIDRPQGAHCENTKIWPYCLSAAGLGLQLYDKVFQGGSHVVYDEWIEYAKKYFTSRDKKGKITSFAFYHDPIEGVSYCPPKGVSGYGMLAPLFYLYPQAPEFGMELYEAGIRDLGWNDRTKSVVQAFNDPRWLCLVLMLAREVGDVTTERRLKGLAEKEWGPDFFADDEDRFAWSFGLDEPYPRGQLNSLLILPEIGGPGAWTNIYTGRKESQLDLPTVNGVDYPNMGISRARNGTNEDTLYVTTYCATKSSKSRKTNWKVNNLGNLDAVKIYCDGTEYHDWGPISENTIEINSTIDHHEFVVINTGVSLCDPASDAAKARGQGSTVHSSEHILYKPATPPTCACC